MIRNLRCKITLVSLCSVAVVLIVILGTVNYLNYRRIVKDFDMILDILVENGGQFPQKDVPEEEGDPREPEIPGDNYTGRTQSKENLREARDGDSQGNVPEEDDSEELLEKSNPEEMQEENSQESETGPGEKRQIDGRNMSPETPYETRFFTVTFDEESDVTDVNTERIAAVDSSTAQEYAEKVMVGSRERGFIEKYRYIRSESEEETLIIFIDCGGDLNSFFEFLKASVIVSIVGILAVLFLLFIFSGKIVAPFVESYEKQKQFITNAGHEIKTPLTIIEADAEIIELESGENEWVKDIHKQIVCLRDLTEDLIFLSKMEEKQKDITKIEFPISDLAVETAQSFQSRAQIQKKTFCLDIEPMISYEGDSKSIQRLLFILLDNALKYSDPGGEISFSLKKKNKNITIIIYNTAEQIDVEKLPHLFERFYRTDDSRNSQTGGHGIGLSIAKAIVSAHEGKIMASSTDGKSLTVTVLL